MSPLSEILAHATGKQNVRATCQRIRWSASFFSSLKIHGMGELVTATFVFMWLHCSASRSKVVGQLYHVGCDYDFFSVQIIFSLAGAVKLINFGF